MHCFYVTALRASAVCLTTTLFSGPAPAQDNAPQLYAFEGVWAQTPTADGCKIAGYIYNRAYVRSTSDEDDSCKVNKIETRPDGTFVLSLSCNDAGGDGPAKRFNVQQTLKWTGSSMAVTFSNGNAPLTLKRCAGDPSVAAAPQPPPPPAKSRAPGESGFSCNLIIGGQRQDWYISLDLIKGLYTARMNNAVVRQRQAAIMDVVLGNTMTPEPGQLRLQVNLGTNMYLVIKPEGQAFLTPPSGSNPAPAGSCKNAAFQGL